MWTVGMGLDINNNLLAIITGLSMIVSCSFIAYHFQKHLFSKYRNKVENAMDNE